MPNILLCGGVQFRYYQETPNAKRSLHLLHKSLQEVAGINHYNTVINGKFSRPKSLLDVISDDINSGCTLLYYFGHFMIKRDDNAYLSHPASNPKKTSSHVNIDEIIRSHQPSETRQLIILIDSIIQPNTFFCKKKYENVLFIVRQVKISWNTWRNGAESFTGCFSDTIVEMYKSVPSITFEQLFRTISYRLGFDNIENCVCFYGEKSIRDTPIFKGKRITGLWKLYVDNLESLSRGSREDGLQSLIGAFHSADKHTESAAILDYFASTDPSKEIRKAARSLSSNAKEVDFSIAKNYKTFSEINACMPKWIFIPSGKFFMGSNPDKDEYALQEEMPMFHTWLPDFYIASQTVTRGQFIKYLEATGSNRHNYTATESEQNLPATEVSWYEAIEYSKWLTYQCEIQSLIESDEEIRLPSEAEWEKAARGTRGQIYPWGNDFKENNCNCLSSRIGNVVEGGKFSPNGDSPYGVQDMSGNVWEWTTSIWGESGHSPEFLYPYTHKDGRENLLANSKVRRIVRGGAFYYFDYCVRAATRNTMFPSTSHSGGGFRLLRAKKRIDLN